MCKAWSGLVTESYKVRRVLSGMWEVGELVDFSDQTRRRGQRIELARDAPNRQGF